jgi:6-phosphogluconolactonase
MIPRHQLRVFPSREELFQAAASDFVSFAGEAVSARGRFTVSLSGGSTPKGLYQLLASNAVGPIPWEKVFLFWGDERHVPPDSPGSNYRMVSEALLTHVPIPADHTFRVHAENPDADAAARLYERAVCDFFSLTPGQFPCFDLVLLGMGPDGHTASLFPGTAALHERNRLFVANWVEKFKTYRLTFTLPVLNGAANVAFLVSGADKAPALKEIISVPAPTVDYPASLIQPASGTLTWLVDQEVAGGP